MSSVVSKYCKQRRSRTWQTWRDVSLQIILIVLESVFLDKRKFGTLFIYINIYTTEAVVLKGYYHCCTAVQRDGHLILWDLSAVGGPCMDRACSHYLWGRVGHFKQKY